MFPELTGFALVCFLAIVGGIYASNLLFLREQVWHVFDPLNLTVFYVSINLALVVFSGFTQSIDFTWLSFVAVCWIFLILGLRLKVRFPLWERVSKKILITPSKAWEIFFFLFVSVIFQLASFTFYFHAIGLGLLTGSVNPDIVKVSITQGGFGIFRHFDSIGTILFIPIVFHLWFVNGRKLLSFLAAIFFATKHILLGFSKAGLVFVVFDIGLLALYYESFFFQKMISKKKLITVILVGLIPATVVLSNLSRHYGDGIFSILANRLVATGGGTYQYFVLGGNKFFLGIPAEKKINWYFDTLFSTLKLKSWERESYSAYLTNSLTGVSHPGFGANPYLFMDAHLFFGFWFGPIYCFLIGLLISFVRCNDVGYFCYYIFVKASLYLVVDPGITQAFLLPLTLFLPFGFFYLIIRKLPSQKNYPVNYRERQIAIPDRMAVPTR